MPGDDAIAKVAYIGSMIATALLSCAIRMYLHRHLELGDFSRVELRSGMAVDLTLAVLFALALMISLLVPAVGYYSMLILFASAPTQLLARRLLRVSS